MSGSTEHGLTVSLYCNVRNFLIKITAVSFSVPMLHFTVHRLGSLRYEHERQGEREGEREKREGEQGREGKSKGEGEGNYHPLKITYDLLHSWKQLLLLHLNRLL